MAVKKTVSEGHRKWEGRKKRKVKGEEIHTQLHHLLYQVLCIMRKEFASYYISEGNFARKDSKFGAGELSSTYFERQVAGGEESRWRGVRQDKGREFYLSDIRLKTLR